MENLNPFKKLKTLDITELQRQSLEHAEQERYNKIAEKIIEILIENKVLTNEIPRVVAILTGKINSKIDKALVNTILKL